MSVLSHTKLWHKLAKSRERRHIHLRDDIFIIQEADQSQQFPCIALRQHDSYFVAYVHLSLHIFTTKTLRL